MIELDAKTKEVLDEIAAKYSDVPVPVVGIANDYGLKVFETYDFADHESGSIRKENGDFIIYLNATHSPLRKRFTLAHELGHYFMHQKELEEGQELVDGIKSPVTIRRGLQRNHISMLSSEEKSIEVQANQFAAELLMPREHFLHTWEQSSSIEEIAEIFKVSVSAASIRAKELLGVMMI